MPTLNETLSKQARYMLAAESYVALQIRKGRVRYGGAIAHLWRALLDIDPADIPDAPEDEKRYDPDAFDYQWAIAMRQWFQHVKRSQWGKSLWRGDRPVWAGEDKEVTRYVESKRRERQKYRKWRRKAGKEAAQ